MYVGVGLRIGHLLWKLVYVCWDWAEDCTLNFGVTLCMLGLGGPAKIKIVHRKTFEIQIIISITQIILILVNNHNFNNNTTVLRIIIVLNKN